MNTGGRLSDRRFFETCFKLAAFLLFLTGAAKLFSVTQETQILSHVDPVLLLTYRQAYALLAVIEFTLAAYLVFGRDIRGRAMSVAWFATMALAYRAVVHAFRVAAPCPCLGNPTAWLGISQHGAEQIALAILGFLFLCGYGVLLYPQAGSDASGTGRASSVVSL